MRAEIDGKIYDTENAKCRFYYDGTLDFIDDFLYTVETLYETEDGEYFLFCEYEPRWELFDGKRHHELEKMKQQIIPLTVDEVDEWIDEKDSIYL